MCVVCACKCVHVSACVCECVCGVWRVLSPRLTVSGTCLSCIAAAWCLSLWGAPGCHRPGCRPRVLPAGLCLCHSAWQHAPGCARRAAGPAAEPGQREKGRRLMGGTSLIDHGVGTGNGLTQNCSLVCEMSSRLQCGPMMASFSKTSQLKTGIFSNLSFSLVHHPGHLQIPPALPSLFISV